MAWTARIIDPFTDPDGTQLPPHVPTLGGSYTALRAIMEIQNNQVGTFDAGTATVLNSQSLANKQAAELTIVDKNGFPTTLVRCTWDGSNLTGYAVYYFVTDIYLYAFNGSGFNGSNIANAAATLNNGDTLRIECDGTTITGLINGVVSVSVSDATWSSGLAGFQISNSLPAAEDFAAYDDGGGGGGNPWHHYRQMASARVSTALKDRWRRRRGLWVPAWASDEKAA